MATNGRHVHNVIWSRENHRIGHQHVCYRINKFFWWLNKKIFVIPYCRYIQSPPLCQEINKQETNKQIQPQLFKRWNNQKPGRESLKKDQHQYSPDSIKTSWREKVMRIWWMVIQSHGFDLVLNSLNWLCKEMYRDYSGEFVCGYYKGSYLWQLLFLLFLFLCALSYAVRKFTESENYRWWSSN